LGHSRPTCLPDTTRRVEAASGTPNAVVPFQVADS
jgi:hypothetical protein